MKIADSFDLAEDKQAKLEVVTSIYQAMISIAQELRGAVERITIWGSGLVLVVDGWLVAGKSTIDLKGKVIISIGIVAFTTIMFLLIKTLQRRYDGVAQVIRKINEVQLAHQTGAYLDGEALFPQHWKEFGTPEWREPIFRLSYVSIPLVAAFGVVVVWTL